MNEKMSEIGLMRHLRERNTLKPSTGSVCQEPNPQPANVCWPKYLRRCENCHALMWRLKSGKWTHRKSEWRNETQNTEKSPTIAQ